MWEAPDETAPKLKPDQLTHSRVRRGRHRDRTWFRNSLKKVMTAQRFKSGAKAISEDRKVKQRLAKLEGPLHRRQIRYPVWIRTTWGVLEPRAIIIERKE